MSAILPLEEYKNLRNIKLTDTSRDEGLKLAIESAEAAVMRYANRDFTAAETVQTKTYSYNGSGVLTVDDLVVLTNLTINERVVPAGSYTLAPDGPPYSLIQLAPFPFGSPVMGFRSNLDTLSSPGPALATVTGTFGWPAPPADVRMAVAFLVDEFAPQESGESGGLAAKSIENYSVTFRGDEDRKGPAVLPPRVAQLLDPFRRPRF